MRLDKNQQAFLALVKAGLWEQDVELRKYGATDFNEVMRLAQEQAVVGLVAAGIEHVKDVDVPLKIKLQFAGAALQLEQRNLAMNKYITELITLLGKEDINAILVKGQGIAQCYERPLWRTAGDIDLLLHGQDYEKAKKMLIPLALSLESEYSSFKHLGMMMEGGYEVELHGTMRSRLSRRVENEMDNLQKDIIDGGNVRSWLNGNTTIYLPSPDNDVVFVFVHILHHFFFEGIGMRQICDWCRLLWTYKESLDHNLLESRIKKAGLMTEWKAFAAFAVEYLGMPVEAMPLYDSRFKAKGERIIKFVLKVGNFGHNQKKSYEGLPYLVRKFISFWNRLSDILRHFMIFPKDSIIFFGGILQTGLHAAVRGE